MQGKVVCERDTLFIRSIKVPFTESAVYQVLRPLVPLLGLSIYLFFYEDGPRRYLGILFWGLFCLESLPRLYQLLFKKSLAGRIPLGHVISFEQRPDEFGLETFVDLKLRNGRTRTIVFRTRENDLQAFTRFLSLQSSPTQLA